MTAIDERGRDCRYFNGYKPCFPGEACTERCARHAPMGTRILIVNLDAMGDVLMTTAQLAAIKRAYPLSFIVWVTHPSAAALLAHNPLIDRVYPWNDESRLVLAAQHFDIVLSADKSAPACAFVASLDCGDVRGFTLSRLGQIIPANPEADYNFRLGLDDHLKFRVNQRTGQDILAETWKLPYERDAYILALTPEEEAHIEATRDAWKLRGRTVVGLNTGCSELFPNKKMTVEQHVHLIRLLAGRGDLAVLLLGGREDTARNAEIAAGAGDADITVISTPTTEGLRRGICHEALADIVVTGDSFGMHLAIALGKHVLAWFGLSCWTEIDLYDRGEKFFLTDLPCSPCWKRACPYNLECISGIDLPRIASSILTFADSRLKDPS
ncbi:MAG: glycosyltransferase family 9 protein [Ignavibacteria bacterium]|nr:glycosyltransferase family 9 protein [Ignavibacteria bacterium]